MQFDKLTSLAQDMGDMVLSRAFKESDKVPIDLACKVDFDKLSGFDEGELARSDPDNFVRLLNNYVYKRLNYLYDEGFLDKEEDFYRPYTDKEMQEQIKRLENNDD